MESQNQNPGNMMGNNNMNMGGNMMPPMPEEKSHFGAISGIVIIVVILALGGLYLWGKELNNQKPATSESAVVNNETAVDSSTQALEAQGTSDNISDIEADLNNTNLENLDADLGSI